MSIELPVTTRHRRDMTDDVESDVKPEQTNKHISEILECLERHMSGCQACRDSPHGPIEKEIFHLKAEKNKLNHSGCLLSQMLFHCFVCLCYMYFLFILLPHFVLIIL